MASITLSTPIFYRAGTSGASKVVGYESKSNRVVRYSFISPSTGATAVSLTFSGMVMGNGTNPKSFRFYIGTDATSYVNAGTGSAYTGTVSVDTSNYTTFTGTASVNLMPNTTYYLFVFPGTTTFGWYNWEGSAAMTVIGAYGASTITAAANVTLGNACSVTWAPVSSSFRFKLKFSLGSWSYTTGVIYPGTTAAYTYTGYNLPLDLANQITASPPTAAMTVTLYTYSDSGGSAQVGTADAETFTVTVPDTVVPTVSLSWTDTSGAHSTMGVLVQNVSKLSVSVTASGSYGSTIVSTAVTLAEKAYSGGVITGSGAQTLAVTVTDSRGRRAAATEDFTVSPYAAPTLSLSASRCTEDGTADDTGEYAKITVVGFVTQVNSKNTASLNVTYGSTSETVSYTPGASFTWMKIVSAPSIASMAISAALTDKLATTTRKMVLSVGYATMDFFKGGRGIAFGATATRDGFHCAMDATFTHTLQVAETESGFETLLDGLLEKMPNYSTAPILWKCTAFSWATFAGILYKYTNDWAMIVGDTYADDTNGLPDRAKKVKAGGAWCAIRAL